MGWNMVDDQGMDESDGGSKTSKVGNGLRRW